MTRSALLALVLVSIAAGAFAGDPYLVKDIMVGPNSSSNPYYLTDVDGKLFFAAWTSQHGTELWMNDPATGTTSMVKDIVPGIGGGEPWPRKVWKGRLWFTAETPEHGRELWWSDGTTTQLLADLYPGERSSWVEIIATVGDTMYLRADHPDYGRELWKTDGTTTEFVADLNPAVSIYGYPENGYPGYWGELGGSHYFNCSKDGVSRLWKLTGETGEYVGMVNAGEEMERIQSGPILTFGDEAWFTGYGTVNGVETGKELWKMTPAGIEFVHDFFPGMNTTGSTPYPNSGQPRIFRQVGSDVYLEAYSMDSTGTDKERELFLYSGGTFQKMDLYPGVTTWVHATNGQTYTKVNESDPDFFAEVGGKLLITASGLDGNGQPTGEELWVLSGTTVTLVTDLHPGTRVVSTYSGEIRPNSSNPSRYAERNGKVYFKAYTPTYGGEIYETDGTAAGTKLFADIYPGTYVDSQGNTVPNSSNWYAESWEDVNGKSIILATDATGKEPWVIDWAAGTVTQLADLNPGSGSSENTRTRSESFTLGGSYYVFFRWAPTTGNELYVTDGTPGGTGLLFDLIPGPRDRETYGNYGVYKNLARVGDKVFFTGNNMEVGYELYRTDGTVGGTGLVADIEPTGRSSSSPKDLVQLGGRAIFWASDGYHEDAHGFELWVTDGTEAGTTLLKDINPGWPSYTGTSGWSSFNVQVGDLLFFRATDGTHGDEVWVSDGTAAGTHIVKDIRPGSGRSYADDLGVAHGMLYFEANDGVDGYELFRTDGTEAGTEMLEIWPGTTTYTRSNGTQTTIVNSANPYFVAEAGGNIYVRATGVDGNGDPTGYELWKADASGVSLVADINPGTYTNTYDDRVVGNNSDPYLVGKLEDGRFLIRATTPAGLRLILVDPSDDSLTELEDMTDFSLSSTGVATDGLVYLRGSGMVDGEPTGSELWVTDGTPGDLRIVKDLYPGTYTNQYGYYGRSSDPWVHGEIDGLVIFSATTPEHGKELFVTDGTAAGTKLLKDIDPTTRTNSEGTTYPNSSNPYFEFTYEGEIYFRADDPFISNGRDLWKTDGTAAGTVLLKKGYSGYATPAHGLVYFKGSDLEHGYELWRSDGTPEGTTRVTDIVPGPFGSDVQTLGVVGDLLYFRADDLTHGDELWALEPSPIFSVDFFPDGSAIDWVALKPMEFTIRVSDWDGDPLSLSGTVNGQPIGEIGPGPTMTAPSGTNPVTSTFQWEPTVAEAGDYTIELTVTDGTNVVTYTVQVTLAGDTDGDGLPDLWETEGYARFGETVKLKEIKGLFQTVGADPLVPDIFVEIDYMADHLPSLAGIEWIVRAFDERHINLHVVLSDEVPMVEELGPDPDFYDWTEFDNYKEAFFTPAHRLAFRYCLFAHKLGPTDVTGLSRNPTVNGERGASDYIVSLGSSVDGTGTQEEQAGTFMHELGHTLGLRHGGHDDQNNKPNYISVMSYAFQFGLKADDLPPAETWRKFNYSFVALPDLDEIRLQESGGVLNGMSPIAELTGFGTRWYWNGALKETPAGVDVNDAIDWNLDGDTLDRVRMNINDQSAYSKLEGHDDWSNLRYTGGLVGGGGIPLPIVTESDELTVEEAREIFPEPPPNPSAPVAVATVPAERFVTDDTGTAPVPLSAAGSYDADGDAITYWWFEGTDLVASGEETSARFAPGPHVVRLIVEDRSRKSEPAEVTFEVVVPIPQTVLVTPDPSSLWPPNNKLREVRLVVEQEDVTCEVTGVTADEEIDGPGAKKPDWELTDSPDVVKLRAERDGSGDGRVYTVTWRCVDAEGLTYAGYVEVTVSHDQGNHGNKAGDDDGSANGGEDSDSGEESDSGGGEEPEDGEESNDDDDPQVAGGEGPDVVGGEKPNGKGKAKGKNKGKDDEDESGDDDAGSGDDGAGANDTPSAPDAPTLDGAGDVGSQAGDTNGGQNPAGAGNAGPQGGIEGGELGADN